MKANPTFDGSCRSCPRLAKFLVDVRRKHPGYHAAPVPPFGDAHARLVIVGLAPGMHGANRTGRPFTGDYAGILLYATLHKYGFGSASVSTAANDGLKLVDCRITNAVKCVPPANKPLPAEVRECNRFLQAELVVTPPGTVILALGRIAHDASLRALGLKPSGYGFRHGAEHSLPQGRVLLDSYHCSRYNTQTRRLTTVMFEQVVARGRELVESGASP